MNTLAVWAELEAKAGKEAEVEAFLRSAQPIVKAEPGTTTWFAVKLSESKFAIFDTFANDAGREAHLSGEVAKALMASAAELFATAPQIHKIDVLAEKV